MIQLNINGKAQSYCDDLSVQLLCFLRNIMSFSALGLIGAFVFGLLLPTKPAVAATRWDLQAGRSYMDNTGTAALFVEGVFDEQRIGNSNFSWLPDISVGWVDGRQLQRYRYSRYTTRDSVWLAAGSVRFHYGNAGGWYHPLFFSFQPASAAWRPDAGLEQCLRIRQHARLAGQAFQFPGSPHLQRFDP